MTDVDSFKLSEEYRLSGVNAEKPCYAASLRASIRAREPRWVIALERSQSLCVAVSGLFHLLIVLAFLITLPGFSGSSKPDASSAVPVELVTLGDETNIAAMVRYQLPFPPSDQQVDATRTDQNAASTERGVEMKLFPQKPMEQPTLSRSKDRANSEAKASSRKDAKIGDYDVAKLGRGTAMTMSVPDFLRNQILACWNLPGDASPQVVVFELFLDGSGSIGRPPRLVSPPPETPGELLTVESVRHAIYTCAPYKMPVERFQQWRQVTIGFDPKTARVKK